MYKYMVMVDAGYVYAEGAKLLYGEPIIVHIDGNKFMNMVYSKIEHYFLKTLQESLPRRLRMYWYDARDRSQWVSNIPGITLRLGRVNQKGTQKGVDGAIIRDMLTISRSQQISDIFLLSGDEDLIEGVSQVKDMGINISILQFKTVINNMSYALFSEADGLIEVHQDDLKGIMFGDAALTEHTYAQSKPVYLTEEIKTELQFLFPSIIEKYSVQELLIMRPRIPIPVDKLIFKHLKNSDSPTELDIHERKSVRGAFWEFISSIKE